jgi:catechol 2,3-dioxygenase-like lactoylglutathione lyase family enzyme
MKQSLVHVSLVVREYDEAIEFFTTKLGFHMVEDTFIPEQNKRWVLVSPPGSNGASLLLAKASSPSQERAVGNQTGGRVAFFLQTDDFERDYRAMLAKGVSFSGEPRNESYGTVAVFADLYGNLWDLLGPARNSQPAEALTITSKPP